MNRRELIRTLLLAGGGSAVAVAGLRMAAASSDATAYYLFTAQPDTDLRRLAKITGGFDPLSTVISSANIAGGRQDLTIRTAKGLVDPTNTPSLDLSLIDYVHDLRKRQATAKTFLAIESGPDSDVRAITIEQGGVVREVISADKNYDRIEVAGPMGKTVFRLRNGLFTVQKASCRHKRCQQIGQQNRIICAPNRLVATLPRPRRDIDLLAG